jgi:hypothetical protein
MLFSETRGVWFVFQEAVYLHFAWSCSLHPEGRQNKYFPIPYIEYGNPMSSKHLNAVNNLFSVGSYRYASMTADSEARAVFRKIVPNSLLQNE